MDVSLGLHLLIWGRTTAVANTVCACRSTLDFVETFRLYKGNRLVLHVPALRQTRSLVWGSSD